MEKQDILKVVRANEGTVLSFPDRGPWGNNRYRGNCSGYIHAFLIEVYDFGRKKNLVLHIYKDEDFDQKTKAYNLVTISTFRNGKAVDDTGDIHVSELDAELERINSYEDFGIL